MSVQDSVAGSNHAVLNNSLNHNFGPLYLQSLIVSLLSAVFFLAQFNWVAVFILIFCIIASSKLTEYLIKEHKVVLGDQMKQFIDEKLKEIHKKIKEKLE